MYVIKISKFLQLTLFHASVSSLTMAKYHLWEVFEYIFKIIAIKPGYYLSESFQAVIF